MNARTASLGRTALVVGLLGLGASGAAAAAFGIRAFFSAYLVAFVIWLGVAFGALGFELIHALAGGRWGRFARRSLHAAMSTLPIFAVFFVPLALCAKEVYPWADAGRVATDAVLQHKSGYLNVPFFIARAVAYFAVWTLIAVVLYRRSVKRGPAAGSSRAMRVIAGPGVVASALCMTFATIDWLMSLEPHWFSTMFGLLIIAGSMLSGVAFQLLAITQLARRAGAEVERDPLHDLGNLMLVFVMVWAYFSFSQYLIIYAGNTAEDIPWYLRRSEGLWQTLALGLILLHFCVPFVVLLSRRSKRSPQIIAIVALCMLVMRVVEVFWFVAPNFYAATFEPSMLTVIPTVLGIGGVWLFFFLRRYEAPELVAEARLAEEASA